MPEELNRLRRRPLLAPLLLPMLGLIAAASGLYWLSSWASTTLVVLVRHAETEGKPGGDPDLSKPGAQRAELLGPLLADLLAGRKVNHLYAADTRRAQQTAASIANEFKLPINLLSSSDWNGLARRIEREHRGEIVVLVGYASTLPAVIQRLSGTDTAMPDTEYDAIYLAILPRPGDPRVLRLRYGERSETVPEKPVK